MPPVDKTILNSKQNQGESFLNELAFEVCVNGDSLEKYKKIVEKRYGNDAYAIMERFVQTLRQQVERGQFTNTSLLNLKYLGKNAGMSEEAIDMIIDHFNSKVKEEQLICEEDEYWKHCDHNDKHALLEYARKYPKGRYVKEAHAKINAINKEENAKREENAFWKQCNTNDKCKLNEYLNKYPRGMYVARAKSLIADLERIEKEAIEESRMFNQCHTQRDYMNFLSSYPNGAYSVKAKLRIEEFERQGRKEIEESRVYKLCKTKKDYQEYLRKYPKGKFVYEAQSKIWDLERKEEEFSRQEENSFWSLCNDTNKDSLQRYLNKYPNGAYASRAKSLIADIERKERETVEESRMYNQCRSKNDYMNFLRKYPNGMYVGVVRKKIDEIDATSKRERDIKEEKRIYDKCESKEDLLRYISLYPHGEYVKRAQELIRQLDDTSRFKRELDVLFTWKRLFHVFQITAGLAYAFLPNIYRWTNWGYIELENIGKAPSLWLFWLPIILSWLNNDLPDKKELNSRHSLKENFSSLSWILYRALLCLILGGYICFDYFDRHFGTLYLAIHSSYNGFVLDIDFLSTTFMGPLICGLGWIIALFCLCMMRKIVLKK
jgi:outer membrane protein assembly factor BamD (BamD/ComL family)